MPTVAAEMLFHAQIDEILIGIENLGVASLWLIFSLLALYVCFRFLQCWRLAGQLRISRISVAELKNMMDSSQQPIVVDVRSKVIRNSDRREIPGALSIDLSSLEKGWENLPADREVIFYCNCPNDVTAALFAKKLIDRGHVKVRPLAGGLDAWIAAGYDTTEMQPILSGSNRSVFSR